MCLKMDQKPFWFHLFTGGKNSVAFIIAQHNFCVSSDIGHVLSRVEFSIKYFFEVLSKCFGCKPGLRSVLEDQVL